MIGQALDTLPIGLATSNSPDDFHGHRPCNSIWDILTDKGLRAALRRRMAEAESEMSIPWEDVKRELKL